MSTVAENIADTFEIPTTKKAVSKERIINEFAKITQYVTWPLLFLLFHSTLKVRIRGQEIFPRTKGPFVIITNHVSFYDSFLFRLVLGVFTHHLPLRFMAVTKFNTRSLNFLAKIGVVDFIYSLFGVFTVTPGLGIEKNIEKAVEIIHIGGNIVIYPEGKITYGDQVGPFKKGAAVLQQKTGVHIIPVSFRLGERKWLRREFFINVGGEINIPNGQSVDSITEILHREVSGLYERV
ncbi:MAG: lysophospholipid acyltransferase family protein [Candidatus Paceibacterota bacterium]